MLHVLSVLLFGLSQLSSAHERGEARANGGAKQKQQQQDTQRLVKHASYDDTDTICYGDDECRGHQVCDMGSYICVTPTPSPVTTAPPGCCYADSYKANNKCNKATDQGRCESNGCHWRVTDSYDSKDCEMTTTTTTTTTEEPGCCMGDSSKTNPMCNAREGRERCEKSSSCHFVSGGVLEIDCIIDPHTSATPGCCYLNPDLAYNKKYQQTCTAFYTERDCLKLTDSNGVARCVFEELIEGYDCSLLWPTTTTTTEEPGCCKGSSYKNQAKCLGFDSRDDCERRGCEFVSGGEPEDCVITTTSTTTTTEEPGCCKGDSAKSNPMCNKRETREQCEKSSSCHFISGGEVDKDCVVDSTTIEPGCCYGNPDAAYSKKWMDTCRGYFTERDCFFNVDEDGNYRCQWEPLGEYMDCEMLWPTTTTTTEEPGCCRGFSYKAQAKCVPLLDQTGCERKGCEWVITDDYDECILTTTTTTTTTTTEEPGCCKGDSARTNERCNKMETRDKCERSSSCHFISGGVLEVDCVVDSTTTEPGCCYGNPDAAYSKRWMESCTAFYTERDCLLLTNGDGEPRCAWEPLGEGYDCAQLWPTTTTTTEEPGCCRGYSYKAQAKCVGLEDQIACERKDCEWVVTDDESECELTTTTTTTTTTTVAPGCCKADSAKRQDMCDLKDTQSKCDRSSSCTWMIGDDPELCEHPTTEVPEEPGCCYGNPDIAYSKRWQETCTTFSTESECTMLTNDDGEARCVFEPLTEGYDCSQLWPTTTTTTTEPGCCYGDSAASNEMCAAFDDDADKCDARGQCVFRSGADADCTFVITSTTEEAGCCKGSTRKNAEMCSERQGREQCERSSKCEFVATADYADCEYDTTTSEPWLGAKSELSSKHPKRAKGANAQHQQEAMLFGGVGAESAVARAMHTQISLSSVLLFVLAAFALHQTYRCFASRRDGDYKQIGDVEAYASVGAYQKL